jgi:sialate O-acetylesterase
MKLRSILVAAIAFAAMTEQALGNVFLPSIFSDHMVVQRNAEITIWGQAKPYETVTITNSWNDEKPSVLVKREGRFALKLHTPDAGGPYTITVQGYNTVTISDVLVGEVWLCSGQSNMEFTTDWVHNFAKDIKAGRMPRTFDTDKAEAFVDAEIKAASHPQIRFFSVEQLQGEYPQNDAPGKWVVCTPDTMKGFSLTGYFFGRELNEKLNVPVGLINSSWGGTPADVWTPAAAMLADPVLAEFAKVRDTQTWGPYAPGVLYNAMIHPLAPFKIAGMIWNQGEENVGQNRGDEIYERLFSTMVQSWRGEWGYDFPVFFVQIPPYRYDSANPAAFRGAQLRDMQRRSLASIPNSEMIVISDIAEPDNIHPVDKLTPAKRLAAWALRNVYHVSDEIPCGPLYKGMVVEKGAVRITFDFAQGALKSADGKPLGGFEIAGADRKFYPAIAAIDGESVIVVSAEVKTPVAVRFAWTNIAMPNLAGSTGLPASAFRTDDWPLE